MLKKIDGERKGRENNETSGLEREFKHARSTERQSVVMTEGKRVTKAEGEIAGRDGEAGVGSSAT
jgi:hypothetical protein